MNLSLIAALILGAGPPQDRGDVGPLVRAVWLLQRYGNEHALDPGNDQITKGALSKALAKDGVLTLSENEGYMEPETFRKLAGPDERLDSSEIRRALEAGAPETRKYLYAQVREHADYLTTTFDPKIHDGGSFETAKYAERRDDIGRLMLSVMMQARRRLATSDRQTDH